MAQVHPQQPYLPHELAHSTLGARGTEPEGMADIMLRVLGNGPDPLIGPPAPATPACPQCEDRGFWYPAVGTDDPAFGQAAICPCRLRRMEQDRPERLARHWQNVTGVPERLRELRLETHPNLITADNPGLLGRLLAADLRRASWYLWGGFGKGKSGIAAGYAWRFLSETGESVLWRTLPGLLEEVRSTYNVSRSPADDLEVGHGMTEYTLIQRYTTAGLLVLDDLGAERLRETGPDSWAADVLYRIIGRRHAAMQPTVFTSNRTLGEVEARLGERIVWRIAEMCGKDNVVEVQGRNLRAE